MLKNTSDSIQFLGNKRLILLLHMPKKIFQMSNNATFQFQGLVYAVKSMRDTVKGKLYSFRMMEPTSAEEMEKNQVIEIKLTESATFKTDNFWPHGISSYNSNGEIRLIELLNCQTF